MKKKKKTAQKNGEGGKLLYFTNKQTPPQGREVNTYLKLTTFLKTKKKNCVKKPVHSIKNYLLFNFFTFPNSNLTEALDNQKTTEKKKTKKKKKKKRLYL